MMSYLKYKITFLLILSTSLYGFAQTSFQVNLDIRAEDQSYKRTQAIIPVFRFTGQPFEDISNFGAEDKEKANTFHAVLPNMEGITDTFYAYIYSEAATNKKLPGYFFTIIGNNKRNGSPTPIWIDRNNNLDLTDDGPPDTINNTMEYLDLVIQNPEKSSGEYVVRISRFSFKKFIQYKFLLNKHYKAHSGNKKFASANYSFKEQRLNLLAGDVIQGEDSFRIAIKDVNCNGIFNEPGIDIVMLSTYNENNFAYDPLQIDKKGKVIFEWKGRQYEIESIQENGSSIQVRENINPTLIYGLNEGEKLPKFKYCKAQNKPTKLKSKKLKKKPVYVFFWNNRTPNFEIDSTYLRLLQEEFGNKIHILAMNYGNRPTQIRKIRINNGIDWTIGFSTIEINKLFHVTDFPRGFFTDNKQKLVNTSISPKELYLQLKKTE